MKEYFLGNFVLALINLLIYMPPLCFFLSAWADGTWSSRDPTSKPRDVQQSNEKLQTRNGKTRSWFREFLTYYIKKASLRILKIKQCSYSGKWESIFDQCERWVLHVSCYVCRQMKTKLGKRSFSFSSSPIQTLQLQASCLFTLELCCFSVIKHCECSWCMQNSQLLILFLKEWQLVVMWAVTWKAV